MVINRNSKYQQLKLNRIYFSVILICMSRGWQLKAAMVVLLHKKTERAKKLWRDQYL